MRCHSKLGLTGDATPNMANWMEVSASTAPSLGAHLNIKVDLAGKFQMGTVLVRNISYRNTTGSTCRDQTTRSVAMSSKVCK